MSRVVVIGASMAGLMAARVMSEHADEVLVLERDELVDDDGARRGVPQGRHAHAILAAGEQRIARWFPGIIDELESLGAVRGDGGDAEWWQAGGLKVRAEVGVMATCVSRPLLEDRVRARVAALPNVTIRGGVKVDDLVIGGTGVDGVIAGGSAISADLVVDSSGRFTRFLDQLERSGYPQPPVSTVQIDMSYATRLLVRRPGDIEALYCIVAPTPPVENRFGVLLPIEGDRWILTIGGFHGDSAPTDDAGFLAFARSLPYPAIAALLERTDPLSPVMTHRLASNQRRHFERLRRVPTGYLALGDAVCSFNPIYGQGMSSAALQAEALGVAVARLPMGSAAMTRAFYRSAAKVVANPWKIAAGADFMHPETTGPKAPGTDFVNRYVGLVQRATHSSPEVLRQMQLVQNLLAPPESLMAPRTMAKVLRASRVPAADPARTNTPVG